MELIIFLIDSRAGFHDMAGVVTAQIPHGIVLFGKDSFQSWFGIQQAVRTIATSQADKPFAIMVDSACGVNGIVSEEEKEHFRQKSYEVFCSDYYDNDMQPGIRPAEKLMIQCLFGTCLLCRGIFRYMTRIEQKI